MPILTKPNTNQTIDISNKDLFAFCQELLKIQASFSGHSMFKDILNAARQLQQNNTENNHAALAREMNINSLDPYYAQNKPQENSIKNKITRGLGTLKNTNDLQVFANFLNMFFPVAANTVEPQQEEVQHFAVVVPPPSLDNRFNDNNQTTKEYNTNLILEMNIDPEVLENKIRSMPQSIRNVELLRVLAGDMKAGPYEINDFMFIIGLPSEQNTPEQYREPQAAYFDTLYGNEEGLFDEIHSEPYVLGEQEICNQNLVAYASLNLNINIIRAVLGSPDNHQIAPVIAVRLIRVLDNYELATDEDLANLVAVSHLVSDPHLPPTAEQKPNGDDAGVNLATVGMVVGALGTAVFLGYRYPKTLMTAAVAFAAFKLATNEADNQTNQPARLPRLQQ